jgi:RluA family pseudouridine synthase
VKLTVQKQSTLIDFISGQYPDSSHSKVKKILKSGRVRINDIAVTLHSYTLKPGDKVEILTHTGPKAAAILPFPVLYEDNELIAIDKPPGLSTSSTDGSQNVLALVAEGLNQISKGNTRAFVVHRLDKEVSGVLLFAKSPEAMNTLKDNWKLTEKHYYALVEGIPDKPEDTIKSWLTEDSSQKVRSAGKGDNAKLAITHYKIIRKFRDHALLDVFTETGRKNQIRVHLSEIGHPLVGDRRYGASAEFVRRIRLHACSLSFPHPVTGEMTTIKSRMPEGFLTLKPRDERYR